ncbi:MAG: tetratricopeptide repeat protein [Gemmatimonadaceae bacterium]
MAYRRTLFDRFGPEAGDYYNALGGSLMAGALGAFGGAYYASVRGWSPIAGGLLCGIAGAVAAWFAMIGVSRAAAGSFSAIIQPQGTYEETFSYEDSLLARGNYAAAIASFEKHAAAGTGGAGLLLRTADLQAKHGNPTRASELYRAVQRMPAVARESHMYATNRLVDLFTGPLNNPDAAISELRRLIATHPSSDAAKHARTALVNLKRQIRAQSGDV